MITFKLILTILMVAVVGCGRPDIIEVQTITDFSEPQSLYYAIKRDGSKVDCRIKGKMNGTLGYYGNNCFNPEKFSSVIASNHLSDVDSVTQLNYLIVFKDSISTEEGIETSQKGSLFCVRFIPGTATKGKIKVEFREHGYGF
ncbi:hypothetical protein [Dyadobacter psychrotolerans]|uniref:Uncharacterized protein n=1 Tax=Dyadobacter psychrotolerans TaxID=2541721 RepID=A0A4R5DDS3_9BACT|nr:hypothetical protein [Dyadobacter psychrotolerans]TDE11976.1 hypothetical protein E0F88_23255 [Dyadobacter psychrotolerans]